MELLLDLAKAVSRALQRARQRHPPPNWNEQEWQKEIEAVAWEAAWEALSQFEPGLGVPLEAFVFLKVETALKDFYRKEWAYFCRHISPPQTEEDEESENWEFALLSQKHKGALMQAFIRYALSQLNERERLVIERVFWDGRTEREVAKELGISQQAVSKIKRQALKKLRELLS